MPEPLPDKPILSPAFSTLLLVRKLQSKRSPPTTHPLPFSKRPRFQSPLANLHTFQPAPFIPYLSSNPHIQTIVANKYPPPPPVSYTRVQLLSTDRLAVLQLDLASAGSTLPLLTSLPTARPDVLTVPSTLPAIPSASAQAPPVAVVLHGLESNADATVTRRIVASLTDAAFSTVVLNFRSCATNEPLPNTLRLYHAGFTDDVETVLLAVRAGALLAGFRAPDVYLSGFSLGANIVCQFLGRWGREATRRFGVVAAAGVCVPFDPTACQRRLDGGVRGMVYSRHLVRAMQRKFREAREGGVDVSVCDAGMIGRADRVGLIDDAYIVPVFRFKDRFDYYQKVDARKVLKRITVPTLIINSRDDPFFDHYSGKSLPRRSSLGRLRFCCT